MQGSFDDVNRINGEINSADTISGTLSVQESLSGTLTDSFVISGHLSENSVIHGTLSSPVILKAEISSPNYIERPRYQGDYTVIPSASVQTLDTTGYVMSDDVTVTEIPYAEVSNTYGTTVSIVS